MQPNSKLFAGALVLLVSAVFYHAGTHSPQSSDYRGLGIFLCLASFAAGLFLLFRRNP